MTFTGLQWKLFRTGLLTSNVVESGGFFDTSGCGRPDIQFHVLPTLVGDVERDPWPGHGISLNPCFLRPASRDVVRLASADPEAPAAFDGRYLSAPEDLATLVRGVKLARRILREAPAHLNADGVLVLEIGNERWNFERAFPRAEVAWLPTSAGDDEVLLMTRDALVKLARRTQG